VYSILGLLVYPSWRFNMRRFALFFLSVFLLALTSKAQGPEVKFIADTLVVQADGTYETDPDLATLVFDISSQDKELKPTYDKASQAIQKIVGLAERNGLKKEDVSSGVLTVTPYYSGDRKKRTKSFLVQGQVVLKVHDFSKLGALLEESVTDEVTDFRSLTYSLVDEEAAKQHAVGEAMRRATGRANAALEQKGQKVGALRFATLDVQQLVGVERLDVGALGKLQLETAERGRAPNAPPPPPPPPLPRPEKITVGATVQCAFQIQ
jgi:uncharacterized protein YggE